MVMKMKNLLGIIYGLVYGASLIIPGLSGSTFLVIFGCYDKVCSALALDFKIIKKHFFFYACFGIGAIAGLVGFVRVITFLIERFEFWTYLAFIVLILAGLPKIIKTAFESEKESESSEAEVQKTPKLKPVHAIPFILGLGAIIALSFIRGGVACEVCEMPGMRDIEHVCYLEARPTVNTIEMGIYSAISAFIMLLPGISGALMLVVFGIYDNLMLALTEFDFTVLVPAIIGILIGLIAGAKLIVFLLKRFRLIAYSAIVGMVVGSIVNIVQNMVS